MLAYLGSLELYFRPAWPILALLTSISDHLVEILPPLGPNMAQLGPNLVQLGLNLVLLGPNMAQLSSNMGTKKHHVTLKNIIVCRVLVTCRFF